MTEAEQDTLNAAIEPYGVAVMIAQDGSYWLTQAVKLRKIQDIVAYAAAYNVVVSP